MRQKAKKLDTACEFQKNNYICTVSEKRIGFFVGMLAR